MILQMLRNEIINARKGKRLKDMPYADRKDAVKRIVVRLYALKAENPTGHLDTIDKCAAEIEARCAKAFPTCTVDELQLAMEAGIRGEWSKDTRIYPANLLMWLQFFATSQERLTAIRDEEREEQRRREYEAMNPSPEEVARLNAEFRQNGPRRAWETFLKEGWSVLSAGYGNAIYEAMVASGEIVLPLDDDVLAEATRRAASGLRRIRGAKVFTHPEEMNNAKWNINTEVVRIVFERRFALIDDDLPC